MQRFDRTFRRFNRIFVRTRSKSNPFFPPCPRTVCAHVSFPAPDSFPVRSSEKGRKYVLAPKIADIRLETMRICSVASSGFFQRTVLEPRLGFEYGKKNFLPKIDAAPFVAVNDGWEVKRESNTCGRPLMGRRYGLFCLPSGATFQCHARVPGFNLGQYPLRTVRMLVQWEIYVATGWFPWVFD